MLDSDVNLRKIASQTKGCSGADIETLVNSSVTRALYRASVDGDEEAMDGSKTKILMSDFELCLKEMRKRKRKRKSVALDPGLYRIEDWTTHSSCSYHLRLLSCSGLD